MKKYIIFGIGLLIVIVILVLANSSIFSEKPNKITNFYYSISGGMDPDSYIVYQFKDGYVSFERGYNLGKKINVKANEKFEEELINVLNKYNIVSWNGFNKSDKYILDGSGFSLNVDYNDHKSIKASGYMKYPRNYREFNNEISELYNKYGYSYKSLY